MKNVDTNAQLTDKSDLGSSDTASGKRVSKPYARIDSTKIGDRVVIFRIPQSPYWYASWSDGRQITRSLGEKKKKPAIMRAREIGKKLTLGQSTTTPRLTIQKAITQFIDSLNSQHRSDSTITNYASHLKCFESFAQREAVNRLDQIDAALLERYQLHLEKHGGLGQKANKPKPSSRGNRPRTVRDKLKVVRRLINWAIDRRKLDQDPSRGYQIPRGPSAKSQPYDERELNLLLTHSPEPWRSVFEFLIQTGLRIGELCHLRKEDVDFQKEILHIRAKDLENGKRWQPKHGRERSIPLLPRSIELLKQAAAKSESTWIFTNPMSQQPGKRVLGGQVSRALKSVGKAAGLRTNKLHAFRAGFIRCMIDNNVNLLTLSELVGHADIKELQAYDQRSPENLRAALLKAAPTHWANPLPDTKSSQKGGVTTSTITNESNPA